MYVRLVNRVRLWNLHAADIGHFLSLAAENAPERIALRYGGHGAHGSLDDFERNLHRSKLQDSDGPLRGRWMATTSNAPAENKNISSGDSVAAYASSLGAKPELSFTDFDELRSER